MKIVTACVAMFATAIFLVIVSSGALRHIELNREIYGKLKQAADANTVELAKDKLQEVEIYLEKNSLTKGNSSILWATPDNDVEFWHQNIKASLDELNNIQSDASRLEVSNTLLKLRESLIDHGKEGDHVTTPDNLNFYPNQTPAALGYIGSLVIAICAWFAFGVMCKG